jgi:putative ABC transport system ATP-binding protein
MTQTDRPDTDEPLLQAHGLTKVYASGAVPVHALRGVDFRLSAGEMVVLLGASGSGKSTLLNILGALDRPTEGEVRFRGEVITGQSDVGLTTFRRDHVGFVFQFYNLVPSLTALENVALVTEIAARPMSAESALAMVGLSDRLNHFPAELSGGEQQRVAIARAIAKQPDLLLCDEPTGALDSMTGRTVLAALTDVNARLGTATVIITHNAAIAGIAHRVVTMADGQIAGEKINATRLTPDDVSW